jgi:hypothetical protein
VRACKFGVMLFVLIMMAVAVGNSPVSADPCIVEPNSHAYIAPNSKSNTSGIIVPVSATCSFVGGQLYAEADAIDTVTNAHVGSAHTVLTSAAGTNFYTGKHVFNVPSQVAGHPLRVSTSIYSGIYNGPYSNAPPLTTGVQTVQIYPYNDFASCYYNNVCNPTQATCGSPSNDGTTQCVGYLYQDSNGCVELVTPVYGASGVLSYQYYTLQKLPATYPAIGTWVSVTGQLYLGNNVSPTGASCPGNYINVSSIS